ncbi:hypothetical protein MBLNU230_g6057t1 [Neophaeotheca triangularis]
MCAILTGLKIVDLSIWRIFRKGSSLRPPAHMLCRGYGRSAAGVHDGLDPVMAPGIPGVLVHGENPYVKALKAEPWIGLPALIGKGADGIISSLLVEHGLYLPVPDSSNLNQISGVPLHELKTLSSEMPQTTVRKDPLPDAAAKAALQSSGYKLSDIRFLRYRMMYAKPSLNAKGDVSFGMPYAHILSRLREVASIEETVHLMKYVFPKQFGLHNVLTSAVDSRQSGHPLMDYTFREQEIARADFRTYGSLVAQSEEDARRRRKVPRRLRGDAVELVKTIRRRHGKCSYRAMLNHYCSKPTHDQADDQASCLSMASTSAQVSAFCRAVVAKVFPKRLWGDGVLGDGNQRKVLDRVHQFVKYRRYETTSLHAVLQDIKVNKINWCAPENASSKDNISKSDLSKRHELISELLYFLFDSFLIPLIRGHFYVTESNIHRNQLFFFRHDVWKELSEPTLASLKTNMLEECDIAQVQHTLAKRQLGFSHVRLLPKERGLRPIINLRRRVQKTQSGRLVLGRSINSTLTPAFAILNYEKSRRPDDLGSALFSVDDMHPRLANFRSRLRDLGLANAPLYFAKVDVQACFDTIPQQRLLQLAQRVLQADEYRISRHARVKLLGGHKPATKTADIGFGGKVSWKFLTRATASTETRDLAGELEAESKTSRGRAGAVYIDGVVGKRQQRGEVLNLLREHVGANLIKIGKRYFRQKEGIPQGSVVSSLLCSYFYAEMERRELGFLQEGVERGRTLLLRLIDDFLVISADRGVAERFVRVMHRGIGEFGVRVKGEKSRVNFDMEVDGGRVVERLPAVVDFPYCGSAINTRTLDISKDGERRRRMDLSNSSTVEYSKLPGQTFYRKTLNAMKLQMHAMLFSTQHNSLPTVLRNLQHSFHEVAQKSYHYIRSLPLPKQPHGKLVIKSVDDLIKLACVLMKRKVSGRRSGRGEFECAVSGAQARWIACKAFETVFQRRQTGNAMLLAWLRGQFCLPPLRAQAGFLARVLG